MTPTLHHEPYPGLHPGTGFQDHLHQWTMYSLADGRTIHACQTCGWPHPKDASETRGSQVAEARDG